MFREREKSERNKSFMTHSQFHRRTRATATECLQKKCCSLSCCHVDSPQSVNVLVAERVNATCGEKDRNRQSRGLFSVNSELFDELCNGNLSSDNYSRGGFMNIGLFVKFLGIFFLKWESGSWRKSLKGQTNFFYFFTDLWPQKISFQQWPGPWKKGSLMRFMTVKSRFTFPVAATTWELKDDKHPSSRNKRILMPSSTFHRQLSCENFLNDAQCRQLNNKWIGKSFVQADGNLYRFEAMTMIRNNGFDLCS